MKTRGPIVFTGASGKQDTTRATGLNGVKQLQDHGDGTATYSINLSP